MLLSCETWSVLVFRCQSIDCCSGFVVDTHEWFGIKAHVLPEFFHRQQVRLNLLELNITLIVC